MHMGRNCFIQCFALHLFACSSNCSQEGLHLMTLAKVQIDYRLPYIYISMHTYRQPRASYIWTPAQYIAYSYLQFIQSHVNVNCWSYVWWVAKDWPVTVTTVQSHYCHTSTTCTIAISRIFSLMVLQSLFGWLFWSLVESLVRSLLERAIHDKSVIWEEQRFPLHLWRFWQIDGFSSVKAVTIMLTFPTYLTKCFPYHHCHH